VRTGSLSKQPSSSAPDRGSTNVENATRRHGGAQDVAFWLGIVAWLILIGGLGGAAVAGYLVASSCEETRVLGATLKDCGTEQAAGISLGIAVGLQSIIAALLLFAGRHVILLLTEIAEKE
jgi:hypothetical protein